MLEQCTFCNTQIDNDEIICPNCGAKKSKSVYNALRIFYTLWILVMFYTMYLLYKAYFMKEDWLMPLVLGLFVFLMIVLNKLRKLPEKAPYDHFVKDGIKK